MIWSYVREIKVNKQNYIYFFSKYYWLGQKLDECSTPTLALNRSITYRHWWKLDCNQFYWIRWLYFNSHPQQMHAAEIFKTSIEVTVRYTHTSANMAGLLTCLPEQHLTAVTRSHEEHNRACHDVTRGQQSALCASAAPPRRGRVAMLVWSPATCCHDDNLLYWADEWTLLPMQ